MLQINDKIIKSYDSARQQRNIKIRKNEQYVKGKNPATLNAPPAKKPDNRITIPLAKIAVNTVQGYAGRAGDIQPHYENIIVSENNDIDSYIDIMRQIAEYNNENIEISELYHDALVQGYSYELFWVSDNLSLPGIMTPEYKKVDPMEIVILWSRDLKPIKEAVMRFQDYPDSSYLDVYYPLYSERWVKPKGSEDWRRDKKGDTKYPYKTPPLVIYKINEDGESLFEAEKGLIDANDKILNKTVNEIDRFNALIMLLPGKVTKEIKDKLVEVGVFDDLQNFDKWPEYLQKDLTGINELYSGAAKWIKDLFFQSVSVPDFSDKDFLNAASGIAMAYKLVGLEFLASTIETYFNQGLKEKFDLLNDVIGESSKYKIEDYKMTINTKRNLPIDKSAIADMVIKLNGIISKETLLKMLPSDIIPDVEKELERIKDEQDNIDLDNIPLSIGD